MCAPLLCVSLSIPSLDKSIGELFERRRNEHDRLRQVQIELSEVGGAERQLGRGYCRTKYRNLHETHSTAGHATRNQHMDATLALLQQNVVFITQGKVEDMT